MMRSMFSAISGLRNHQTFMDVVGNNIANINTTGFKQSRVTFQDILSQTIRGGSSPQGGRGGVNPAQVGLGMLLGGIDTIQTQGTLQSTGKLTDIAIQGDGFFVLGDGRNEVYSRDGAFDLSIDGTLVNPSNGLKVMGWQAASDGSVDPAGLLSSITIPIGQGMESQVSRTATFTGNLNQAPTYSDWAAANTAGGKLTVSGTAATNLPGTAYRMTVNSVTPGTGAVATFTWEKYSPTTGTWASTGPVAGNSFTDDGLTFSMSADVDNKVGDAYYTNAQSSNVTLYDSLGEEHGVQTIFQKTPLTGDVDPTNDRNWTWVSSIYNGTPATRIQTGTGTLSFDTAGKASAGVTGAVLLSGPAPGNGAISNGAADMNVSFDFASLTQLAGNGDLAATTDGAAAGTLSTFSIGQSGEVTGIYSNGRKRTIGQLALASFANPAGLMKSGGNLFVSSANSGTARIGTPDSNGRGQVSTGFLEMSNVDLAQQFTNMIMAERGFQANSRVITTSDEILQDLVNIKR